MRRRTLLAVALVVWCSLAARAQTREKPSTPDERARAIQVTKKLERQPLGQEATQERAWLTRWIIEIPDLTVPVCDEVLKPLLQGEVGQYRYSKELVAQEMAGAMSYIIEHPQAADQRDPQNEDDFSINRAGLESALNAYESIVKNSAKGAKWGPLEEMLRKRKAGQLEDYVRSATLKCVTGDTVTAALHLPNACAAR